MKLSFNIAFRFLKSGRGQTLLIILGISIGVSVQVFIGSLIQGLQLNLVETVIGNSSQITVSSTDEEKTIKNWRRVLYEAGISDPDVINVSAVVQGPASIDYEEDIDPVTVRGFIFEQADKIYKIKQNIYSGRLPEKKDEAIIGRELAEKTQTEINEKIMIITPSGGFIRMTVSGIYDLNNASINESWVITNLETAQEIFGLDNNINSVEMQVKEVFEADTIAGKIEYTLSGENLKVDNWKDQNAQLLGALNAQSVSSYMIQVFVMIAVLLGISSVLAISVVQRSRQIGILKAMGIQDKDASLIFVFQGVLLGITGAFAGVGLGLGLLYMFKAFVPSSTVPIYINPGFIILSGLFAVAAAVSASLVPARISSGLSPVEVIKNG